MATSLNSVSTFDRTEALASSSRLGQVARKAGLTAAVAAVSIGLFFCYLRQSLTVAPTSDGAANALQAWDMLHGNLLLHGWALSDVSFYTTELPEYMLVEWTRGLNIEVVNIAGALTYTALVVVAALLARGTATGRQGVLRMIVAAGIMLSPQLGPGVNVMILQPDHVGTAVPVLLAWLVLDRGGRRWWVPIAVGVLLTVALIADPVVLYIGVGPLVAIMSARVYGELVKRRGDEPAPRSRAEESGDPRSKTRLFEPRWIKTPWFRVPWFKVRWLEAEWLTTMRFELSLIVAALIAVAIGLNVPALMHALGGYDVASAPNAFGVPAQMTSRVWLTLEGILLLFGANFFGSIFTFATGLVLLHVVGLALATWGFCRAVRSFSKTDDTVARLLVVGTAVIIAAYLFGVQAANIATTREMAAVLPFGAVLAGRLVTDRLRETKLVSAAAIVLLGYALTLGINVNTAPAPPVNGQLVTWLESHGYRYGLANYWQANSVALATENQVKIRALTTGAGFVIPYQWESKSSWYNPHLHSANFVALLNVPPGNQFYLPMSQVLDTFGPSSHTYHVGSYTVLVWNYNLLTRL